MGDLTTRARQVSVRGRKVWGSKTEQQHRQLERVHVVVAKMDESLSADIPLKANEMADTLFEMAVLCGLSGLDVEQLLSEVVMRKEISSHQPKPGEAAPIPDAAGMFRDPANGRVVSLEGNE